jgi:hypothetical protein
LDQMNMKSKNKIMKEISSSSEGEENEEEEEEEEELDSIDDETSVTSDSIMSDMDNNSEMNGFGDKLNQLLNTVIPPTSSSAILIQSKGIENKLDQAILDEKAQRILKHEKRKLKELGHISKEKDIIITNYDYEKKLKKIATKGVVQLFNAINQHQIAKSKQGSNTTANISDQKKIRLAQLSNNTFLDLLKTTTVE